MSNPFHLAIPASDLSVATKFYVDVLGCKLGNKEADKWIDVDFWGNELTLHKTEMKLPNERHEVDMGNVPVPHFGVHLDKNVFNKIKEGDYCEVVCVGTTGTDNDPNWHFYGKSVTALGITLT